MRFKVFTNKNNFISMVFEAVEFDSETRIKELNDNSMLIMFDYKCDKKEIYYTTTMCINEKQDYCDIILHEQKRTLWGKNIISYNIHKRLKKVLLKKKIDFKVLERESPVFQN